MKREMLYAALALGLLAGCGTGPAEPTPTATPALEHADAALYRQLALYIRRGLRDYGLPGEYTLSFGPVDEREVYGVWVSGEELESCGFYKIDWDPQSDWYVFTGLNEFFLVDDEISRDEDWETVYTLELDTETPPAELEKFDSPPVPVETTFRHWNSFDPGKAARNTYHYVDKRLGIDLMGEYPEFYEEETVNAAFYGVMEDFFFTPEYGDDARTSPYTTLELTYRMTREDETFASARFYHNAYTRGAAHPSDWETGLTVDRETGQVLTLDDVLDWDGDAAALLERYDWKPSWTWEGNDGAGEIEYLIHNSSLGGFYLTEDRLGLIMSFSRYYTPIEAPLVDLPIKLDKLT